MVLEWDPIDVATAELRSLTLFRNGSKAGNIPKPLETQSTKLSGLAVDTEYVFHLVLRTSAGTFASERLGVRTHKMTDLSGITVTPGLMPAALRESLQVTVGRIGAKMVDSVRIDTTHFVCTEGRGQAWEKAMEMNIPVVVPDWVKGCEREGRIVGVRGYYLNADPRLRQIGPGAQQQGGGAGGAGSPQLQQGQQGQQERLTPQAQAQQMRSPPLPSPRTEVTPPTPERATHERRESDEDEKESAPPPPPKDDGAKSSSEGKQTPEPKTQAKGEEQKARTEDVKPAIDGKDKGKDEDSEEEEEEKDSGAAKAVEADLPERNKPPKPSVEDDEDNGSFQEVQL